MDNGYGDSTVDGPFGYDSPHQFEISDPLGRDGDAEEHDGLMRPDVAQGGDTSWQSYPDHGASGDWQDT